MPSCCSPKGAEEWGRWSQDEDFISLELFVDASIIAKDVLCEVSVGFLDVRLKDTPLLSGRLAQQVIVSELNWALDDDAALDDGRRAALRRAAEARACDLWRQ